MNTISKRNDIIKQFLRALPDSWTLRRICKADSGWVVKESAGDNLGGELSPGFGSFLNTLLDDCEGMENEILILSARKPGPLKRGNIDLTKLSHEFDSNLRVLEKVSWGAFVDIEFGVTKAYQYQSNESITMIPGWQWILESMPFIAQQLRHPVYLLFAGRGIDHEEVERFLPNIVDQDASAGTYASLGDISSSEDVQLDGYEFRLALKGMKRELLERFRNHVHGISDSGVKEALLSKVESIPWRKKASIERDLDVIRQRLDQALFGMNQAKEEVLAAVAGSMLSETGTFRPPRILLHGKPGTGKTAMAKAIAEALGIPFQSISMNGISTAISIAGLEPFWRSPQPGKIIQSMIDANCMNPMLLLDEIEKCGQSSEHGSPLEALLQALDPSQNRHFHDLYIGLPVDISEIFFVATANSLEGIPEPLLDRMLVIQVDEYTVEEKVKIVPYLLEQLAQEYELPSTPVLEQSMLDRFVSDLFVHAGLREIKYSLWRLLCEEAVVAEDFEHYRSNPTISTAHQDSLLKNQMRPRTAIGFI